MESMPFLEYTLMTLILIMILIWIYIRTNSHHVRRDGIIRQEKINDVIEWLYSAVTHITNSCNMFPEYNIIETKYITYTDKITSSHNTSGNIYLVIWNDKYNTIFMNHTLIYAMLHEISHILSPSIHHEPPFNSIETILLNKAVELGYYNPNTHLDPDYITLDTI